MRKPNKAEKIRAAIQQSAADDGATVNSTEHPVKTFNRDDAFGIPVQIPVDLINPNPDQPRTIYSEAALNELAEDVKKHGILSPPMARKDDNGETYTLHFGHRRLRAAKILGLATIPIIVKQDVDSLEIAWAENAQRENLTPLEKAEFFARLKDKKGYTDQMIADLTGKSRSSVTEMLTLNTLPDDIKADMQADVEHSTLPKSLILQVVRADDPQKVWAAIKSGEIATVREAKTERKPQIGRPNNFIRHLRPEDGKFRVTVAFSKQHVSGKEIKAALNWANNQLS